MLAHVLIHTINASLENREKTFNCVRVSIPADIFIRRMDDGAVTGELLADTPIDAALVGTEMRIGRERFSNNRL